LIAGLFFIGPLVVSIPAALLDGPVLKAQHIVGSGGAREGVTEMTEATILDGRHAYRPQAIGRVFGWFFLATFITSILAYFVGYAQMLDDPGLITGTGADPSTGIASGATLEVLLIIANVATAVVVYPVLKRESEMGAIGYVSARLVEAMFIAIGIVGALKIRVGAPRYDVARPHRRSARHDHRDSRHVQRDSARGGRSRHRDDPRVLVGAVAKHLLHREGVQALFPDPAHETVTRLPETDSALRHEA
jgi:hypothetical protein